MHISQRTVVVFLLAFATVFAFRIVGELTKAPFIGVGECVDVEVAEHSRSMTTVPCDGPHGYRVIEVTEDFCPTESDRTWEDYQARGLQGLLGMTTVVRVCLDDATPA